MTVDNRSLDNYKAKLLANYSVSGSPIENTVVKGRDRPSYLLTSTSIGLKTITLPLRLSGENHHEIALNKSRLDMACHGRHELWLPDGFWYSAILEDAGTIAWRGMQIGECTYVWSGIQHGSVVVGDRSPFFCSSTVPKTDCILSATVGADADKYNLNGIVFLDVQAGDNIVADGIDKRILLNGGPAANRCVFFAFPYLVPGENVISAPDPVTVTYFPTYI